MINDWNEQYSPPKSIARKTPARELNKHDPNNVSSPTPLAKSISKSPGKRDKAAMERRKAFDAAKHDLANSFLQELDQKITAGQISSLATTTGGIQIRWNKKLNTTAGRANWKKVAVHENPENKLSTITTYRHHASIELAEKVIDDQDRLINVLAHEFCHLANFMISGVKDKPHGKAFKEWASKCSTAFGHLGVKVSTKHSYAISYKYIWTCISCGIEYKRHSKSIDPERHTCGSCKSKLEQTLPIPRGGAPGMGLPLSNYQEFVKARYATVRIENPGKSQQEIMSLVGAGYKDWKAQKTERLVNDAEQGIWKEEIMELPAIEIGAESENTSAGIGEIDLVDDSPNAETPYDTIDVVARDLDLLSLETPS